MTLSQIKEINLSYSGKKNVSSKDIINFTKDLFGAYRKNGKSD